MRSTAWATLALLAACGSLDPITVARLAALDPLAEDPAAFSVGLDLPDGLAIPPGGAELTLSARNAEGDEAGAAAELTEGADGRWRVTEADLPALREAQRTIRAWKAADPDGTIGSLSLELAACRDGSSIPPAGTVSADIVTAPGAAPAPLLRRVPADRLLALAGGRPGDACADMG